MTSKKIMVEVEVEKKLNGKKLSAKFKFEKNSKVFEKWLFEIENTKK